jgi:two-component system chemotaxis sensor kinase CheA
MDKNEFKSLTNDYLADSEELLEVIEGHLFELEAHVGESPDPGLLEDALRQLHTFKGNSGLIGFPALAEYTHGLEDIFKEIEKDEIELDDRLLEFLFRAANTIKIALSKISADAPEDPDLSAELVELESVVTDLKKKKSKVTQADVSREAEARSALLRPSNILRVDFSRLDNLLNLMSELVMQRTRLGQLCTEFQTNFGEIELTWELSSTSDKIGKISTDLHEAIMNVRMLPIRQVLRRFPAHIRDLARKSGKEVDIIMEGEGTELDKKVIDELGEPLLHLLRNAVDHGIETPDEREKLGKPRRGTISIRARQESSHISISVADDGAGIDYQRLREDAARAGLLEEDQEEELDLSDLIYMSGFSTADAVTEISGRGVGMDVVKKSISRLNGSIELKTEAGIGTEFIVTLPITLAIISALMVETGGEQYAIPLANVLESHKILLDEIHVVNEREVIDLRGQFVPLVRLGNVFGLAEAKDTESAFIVVVQDGMGMTGIVVNALVGQQEIVVKVLDEYIGDSVGIAGTTILGDGSIVLIVDVSAVTRVYKGPGDDKGWLHVS